MTFHYYTECYGFGNRHPNIVMQINQGRGYKRERFYTGWLVIIPYHVVTGNCSSVTKICKQ